ncbi:Bcr/CflA family drug resistance efflux transporter [Sphaerisporangium krabiense]|uniref:DHA1 family bicyclomycin/chloramphenicol resistance-like MFS transporter n=1 Tax=Sphaerisporangium krabiense TaxID=763782 RepID=A0A7W8Z544_9ACTN|nr:multidrug effflux MFS transporter [Sphaerisporangium krabiense]MBB5627589.1 DHA1 family bicyclomycin/chloramphenicol resistance-like MFS transporter [Sphaerisporangium krabiense]GII66603.1 Bcr/CflA family drug resistance efflux transporter [Sphaerisporangium krabiense]
MSEIHTTGSVPVRPKRRVLLVMGALSTFGPLSIDLYLPALPQMAHQLHASDSAAQWSISMCLIGLATGQLFIGPLSDRIGRKRPLFVGVVIYAIVSLLCAVAPSMATLNALRLVQGLAGSAGTVIVGAMVRDMYEGQRMARILSLLMLVGGIAPIVSPVLGGQLLYVTDWRGIFVTLGGISVLLVVAVTALPETLRPELRHVGGLRRVREGFGSVVRDRVFLGCALGSSVGGAALFIYISVSAFVLEGGYGVSAQVFSFIFGVNSVGLMLSGYVNALLLRRLRPEPLLIGGAVVAVVASVLCLAAALLHAPLAVFLPALFLTVASGALASPNATALALVRHAANAGTAAALFGGSGFMFGALLAPVASIGGASAIAMTCGIALARIVAWGAYRFIAIPGRRTALAEEEAEGGTAPRTPQATERERLH